MSGLKSIDTVPSSGRLTVSWNLAVSILLVFSVSAAMAQPGTTTDSAPVTPFTILYDTGIHAESPITHIGSEMTGDWVQVSEDMSPYAFSGDAVMLNDRLALIFRKNVRGAELYTRDANGLTQRATLTPFGNKGTAALEDITVRTVSQEAVVLEVSCVGEDAPPLVVAFELSMGQPFVKTTVVSGADGLRVEAPTRFAVLPDFFADDIVIDAHEIPVDSTTLPSENFLLQMLPGNDAILMEVWENRDQDVSVFLGDGQNGPTITSSEISYGKEGVISVALLAAPGIWQTRTVTPRDRGRVIPLNWRSPFTAVWRVDWRRSDGLTDSWEMMFENGDGTYTKPGWFQENEDPWTASDWYSGKGRRRWSTDLGGYQYPCWFDTERNGFIEPLRGSDMTFAGPLVIYPVNRRSDTPLDQFTVVDIIRSTLGVGPCQYILDVEGQKQDFQGKPTCAVREVLTEIYGKGRQVEQQADVEQALDDVLAFIIMIRKRIDAYAEFSREMQDYLAGALQEYPELETFIKEMDGLTKTIDRAISKRREGIKSPAFAAERVDEFRANVVGYEGDDALQRCKRIADTFVGIGDNQDELVADCRLAVKRLRQKAALAQAEDPHLERIVEDIRRRTHDILRSPVNYEAPRH